MTGNTVTTKVEIEVICGTCTLATAADVATATAGGVASFMKLETDVEGGPYAYYKCPACSSSVILRIVVNN